MSDDELDKKLREFFEKDIEVPEYITETINNFNPNIKRKSKKNKILLISGILCVIIVLVILAGIFI